MKGSASSVSVIGNKKNGCQPKFNNQNLHSFLEIMKDVQDFDFSFFDKEA